ncbi:NBS-containing resistance-like protein, partial [Trifolium medium]|nr:NBS-containing resistance-like protein [Trifolium medium]
EIKHELQSIKAFLKDADTRAADEGVKAWVDQLRETSFRIEDVIDEYVKYLSENVNNSGSIALIKKITTVNQRDQIASAIQDIKSSLVEINERRLRYDFKAENGPGSSRGATQNENDGDPRMASLFIEATQIVGFEKPTEDLVRCLVEGTKELVLVSVVGMGGLGKTTLSNHVFHNERVKEHFDYRLFITVSQSYTVRELLINMVKKFYKNNTELIPKDLQEMDCKTLIEQVIQFLESKRYLLLFDDVWTENFSDDIEHALINNNKGSRIIVTTRMMPVAEYFKKSFTVHIHELQFLPEDKACELFRKKAFRSHPENQCPKDLVKMSNEIVKKCEGLPLAIVVIGGLLSTKANTTVEWEKDYTIKRKRLTRQWMAEGFVRYEKRRTLEDVAEEYLTELIQRSLVNV